MTMLRVSVVDQCEYRSHALRGNAVLDALRPVFRWVAMRSVGDALPTQSVGTRERKTWGRGKQMEFILRQSLASLF